MFPKNPKREMNKIIKQKLNEALVIVKALALESLSDGFETEKLE